MRQERAGSSPIKEERKQICLKTETGQGQCALSDTASAHTLGGISSSHPDGGREAPGSRISEK